jgi:hypothetical protein
MRKRQTRRNIQEPPTAAGPELIFAASALIPEVWIARPESIATTIGYCHAAFALRPSR